MSKNVLRLFINFIEQILESDCCVRLTDSRSAFPTMSDRISFFDDLVNVLPNPQRLTQNDAGTTVRRPISMG
jgi:hypothetical protein